MEPSEPQGRCVGKSRGLETRLEKPGGGSRAVSTGLGAQPAVSPESCVSWVEALTPRRPDGRWAWREVIKVNGITGRRGAHSTGSASS